MFISLYFIVLSKLSKKILTSHEQLTSLVGVIIIPILYIIQSIYIEMHKLYKRQKSRRRYSTLVISDTEILSLESHG